MEKGVPIVNISLTGALVFKFHSLRACHELKFAFVLMNKLFYETERDEKVLSQAQQTGIQLAFSIGLTCPCHILSSLMENWNPGVEQPNLLNTCCKKFIQPYYIGATNYSS
jgi:hypothetical protein